MLGALEDGYENRFTIGWAGVMPIMVWSAAENPYEVDPTRSPPMYTGDPDIPATMPPVWSRKPAGPVIWARMKSRPGAMPPGWTPRIFTSKWMGVLPWMTVHPVAVRP